MHNYQGLIVSYIIKVHILYWIVIWISFIIVTGKVGVVITDKFIPIPGYLVSTETGWKN